MAQLNLFRYHHRSTPFHNWNGRTKLLGAIILSITAGFAAQPWLLALVTTILLILLILSKLPLKQFSFELRYLLCLSGIITLVHTFSIPGTPLTNIPLVGASLEGLFSGLLFSWRLILFLMISTILTGTTTLSSLQTAICWLLRPLPFINERRIATLFNMTFVLIPLIFDEANQLREAQRSRCIDNRKNPLQQVVLLVYPLLRQTFRKVEEIALAMEARGYQD